MPSINMIANRRAEKRRQEKNIRNLIYGITAEVGCVLVAVGVLYVREVSLHNQSVNLTGEIHDLAPKVSKIEALQSEIASMQPKVQTLDAAKADTLFWYNNLYAITTSLPDRTWLTSLVVAGAATGAAASTPGGTGSDPTISLAGVALNQATVGEAMLRMNQSPGMDHIDLSYVQSQKTGDTDTVAFQLTAHLKPEPGAGPKGGSSDVQKS